MIYLDPALSIPPYEQLKNQIMAARDSEEFPSGYRLPPVRRLALELGVAPGTVARAYKDLEREGVVETRGRLGTYLLPSQIQPASGCARFNQPPEIVSAKSEQTNKTARKGRSTHTDVSGEKSEMFTLTAHFISAAHELGFSDSEILEFIAKIIGKKSDI